MHMDHRFLFPFPSNGCHGKILMGRKTLFLQRPYDLYDAQNRGQKHANLDNQTIEQVAIIDKTFRHSKGVF